MQLYESVMTQLRIQGYLDKVEVFCWEDGTFAGISFPMQQKDGEYGVVLTFFEKDFNVVELRVEKRLEKPDDLRLQRWIDVWNRQEFCCFYLRKNFLGLSRMMTAVESAQAVLDEMERCVKIAQQQFQHVC